MTELDQMIALINETLPQASRIDLSRMPRVRLGMSAIQITAFVLNNKEFPTDFAKAHQAKFEIWNRVVDLMRYVFESRKGAVKAEMLARDLSEEADPLKRRLTEIKIAETEFSRAVNEQWAMERAREIGIFWEVYLRHQAGDPEDPEDLHRLELQTWQTRMEIEPQVFAERHHLDPARIAAVVRAYYPELPTSEEPDGDTPFRIRYCDPRDAPRRALSGEGGA